MVVAEIAKMNANTRTRSDDPLNDPFGRKLNIFGKSAGLILMRQPIYVAQGRAGFFFSNNIE
jgi:hypothetical protein